MTADEVFYWFFFVVGPAIGAYFSYVEGSQLEAILMGIYGGAWFGFWLKKGGWKF